LWLRGTLPNDLGTHSGALAENPPWFRFGGLILASAQWESGSFGTDASGGMFTSVPTLRRMAFAVVCLDQSIPFHFKSGVKGALPGPVQTVPSGGLYVVLIVVRSGITNRSSLVYTKSEVNLKLYTKGRDNGVGSVNSDLWIGSCHNIDANSLSSQLQFVPRHPDDEKKRAKGYTACEYAVHNNIVADHVAEVTARQTCLPPSITAKVH